MSWLFASGDQSIKASASASVLPINSQCLFPLGLTGLISLLPRGSQESSPAPQFKSFNSLALSLFYGPTLTSIYGKTITLAIWTFIGKVMSLVLHTLTRLDMAPLPRLARSKSLLIDSINITHQMTQFLPKMNLH